MRRVTTGGFQAPTRAMNQYPPRVVPLAEHERKKTESFFREQQRTKNAHRQLPFFEI